MRKKAALIIISMVGVFLFLPTLKVSAAFSLFDKSCTGEGAKSSICQDVANKGGTDPIAGDTGIVQTAANLVAVITGITAVVMIIISGFRLVTSGGETEKVSKAKSMLIGSVIGLVIVALAWVLISFIISRFVYS